MLFARFARGISFKYGAHARQNLATAKALPEFLKKFDDSQNVCLNITKPKTHNFDSNLLKSTATTNKRELATFIYQMNVIRHMEQELSRLYKEKLIRGFCHLYSGQEACCIGIESAITLNDSLITAYRAHGYTYTRETSVRQIIAELLGRETGCSKGRGGSMHTFGTNFYGGNGIVGAQVPIAAGIALKHQYCDDKSICVGLYGDGAANQGQLFETFNMAALWKLPAMFVCENNLYAMGTSVERHTPNGDFYTRCEYIPGLLVDGNCLFSVREAVRTAAEHVRSGKGPIIVELRTYRYFGHSVSDPGTSYRSLEEVKERRTTTDPIRKLVSEVVDAGVFSEKEVEEIDSAAIEHVESESELAQGDPFPKDSEFGFYVYSEVDGHTERIRGPDQYTYYDTR